MAFFGGFISIDCSLAQWVLLNGFLAAKSWLVFQDGPVLQGVAFLNARRLGLAGVGHIPQGLPCWWLCWWFQWPRVQPISPLACTAGTRLQQETSIPWISFEWKKAHLYGLAGSHQGIQQLELGKPWPNRSLSSCTSKAWMELNAAARREINQTTEAIHNEFPTLLCCKETCNQHMVLFIFNIGPHYFVKATKIPLTDMNQGLPYPIVRCRNCSLHRIYTS